MAIRVVMAGATGWVGRAMIPAILAQGDMTLAGAVARSAAGQDSGTALGLAPNGVAVSATLAEALAEVRGASTARPAGEVLGVPGTRGAAVGAGAGVQVHALRLPSYILSCEALFGLPDERLTIRHDAGSSAAPYVAGTLLAIRRVADIKGLVRGLDALMD